MTDGRTYGGDCNISDAFLKSVGIIKVNCMFIILSIRIRTLFAD